jgi:hypothetical protein
MGSSGRRVVSAIVAVLCFVWLATRPALAAPQAKIMRIDPRASIEDDAPILTTVIDLVQHTAMSDITSRCAQFTKEANFECIGAELDKPRALYKPFKFPEESAVFTVEVDERDMPAKLVGITRWGDDKKSVKGVGTAWLFVIDAAASMEGRFDDAKALARVFIDKMAPSDIAKVMLFNDADVVGHDKWTGDKKKSTAFVDGAVLYPKTGGRARPLFNIIKKAATDGFQELGNTGSDVKVPMHQAMVVLSNGLSGSDVTGPAATAKLLSDYLTGGRFPEDNTTLPKAPVSVVSIWFPKKDQEEYYENAHQFMENLANPSVGGYHNIVLPGGGGRANAIVMAVTQRFDEMHIVKWRVPCVAPKLGQTFNLIFKDMTEVVAGDGTFKNVPIGIDPTLWPLEIDVEQTMAAAKKDKVHPGGKVKIFGNFCWGTESMEGRTAEDAKKAQNTLIGAGLVGKALTASDEFVEFEVPDKATFLRGTGKDLTAQLVIVDQRTKRSSPLTAGKILELPAEAKPIGLALFGGLSMGILAAIGGGALLVIILLVVLIARGGGSRRPPANRPPPVVAR